MRVAEAVGAAGAALLVGAGQGCSGAAGDTLRQRPLAPAPKPVQAGVEAAAHTAAPTSLVEAAHSCCASAAPAAAWAAS